MKHKLIVAIAVLALAGFASPLGADNSVNKPEEQSIAIADINTNNTNNTDIDYRPRLSAAFFDLFFNLGALPDLKFSFGIKPNITFPKSKFGFTPIFAFYRSSYTIYHFENQDVYINPFEAIDFGGLVTYKGNKYNLSLGADTLYSISRRTEEENKSFQYRITFQANFNNQKANYYRAAGEYASTEISYFINGPLCISLRSGVNADLYRSAKKGEDCWRVISTTFAASRAIISKNATDWVLTKYCFDRMFTANPGISNLERLSFYFSQTFFAISPYFINHLFAWYARLGFEGGVGIFGKLGTDNYNESCYRIAGVLETGFRWRDICNFYIRVCCFYPEFDNLKKKIFFLFDANIA